MLALNNSENKNKSSSDASAGLNDNLRYGNMYAMLFNAVKEGIAFNEVVYNDGVATDYVIYDINPAFEEITGLSRTDIIGRTASSLFGAYSAPFTEVFSKVAATGIATSFEDFYTPINKYLKISAYSFEKGKFVSVLEDISHKKNMENVLRERIISIMQPIGDIENIKFTDLFDIDEIQKIQDTFADATGVGSVITEPNGVPITKPSNFCNLCTNVIRSTPKGLANCTRSDIIIGKSSSSGPNVQQCLSGGLYDGGASITVGNKHIANWLVGQVLEENADLSKMQSYALEIGADPEVFAEELKHVYRMPKQRFVKVCETLFLIARQLSDLALNNFQQARILAEKEKTEQKIKNLNAELASRNKELEQIIYVTSHDLRSPLVNVQGFSNELKENISEIKKLIDSESFNDKTKNEALSIISGSVSESFEFVIKSTKKMDTLISGLLKISRLGRNRSEISQINMNDLVKDVIKTFNFRIEKEECEVSVKDIPDCYGDYSMLSQLMSNLIDNSLKYKSPARKGKIIISGEIVNEDCVYCVKDNGIGIPKGYQAQVFELFRSLNPQVKGDGLGLAIVRKIIEKHNGAVWIESDVDEGCCFYFSIPNIKK